MTVGDATPLTSTADRSSIADHSPITHTSSLALLTFIAALVFPVLVPIPLGHIALRKIAISHQPGRGLALTGLIVGYIYTITAIFSIITVGIGITLALNTWGSRY